MKILSASVESDLKIFASMLRSAMLSVKQKNSDEVERFCVENNLPTPLELAGHAATINRLLEEQ